MCKPKRIALSEWNDATSAELTIESAEGEKIVVQVGPREEKLQEGFITDGYIAEDGK